jgi:hypothetical protein
VVLATKHVFASASERDRTCAVPANIAECAQHALFIANDDDRFAGDLCREKGFGIGNGFP